MLGKQDINTDLFQCVCMEQLVPPNHILRRLAAVIDLRFVRESVAHLYSAVGRNSADPEVVVRMWILQHLYDFSERQVCEEVTMHAGFRWFCGLSFNDTVPDQSTLVKLRNAKWAGTGLWEELLCKTVIWCEKAGICRPGGRMGIDGTQIDARAATVSLEAKPPELTIEENEVQTPADAPAPPPCASLRRLRSLAARDWRTRRAPGRPTLAGRLSSHRHRMPVPCCRHLSRQSRTVRSLTCCTIALPTSATTSIR